MTKEDQKQKLLSLKQNLTEYLSISINENNEIKQYFNNLFDYNIFEIIEYKKDEFYEYLTFDLSTLTKVNIFSFVHNKKTYEYKLLKKPVIFTAKTENINISREMLKNIFNIARENQILLEADKYLVKKLKQN